MFSPWQHVLHIHAPSNSSHGMKRAHEIPSTFKLPLLWTKNRVYLILLDEKLIRCDNQKVSRNAEYLRNRYYQKTYLTRIWAVEIYSMSSLLWILKLSILKLSRRRLPCLYWNVPVSMSPKLNKSEVKMWVCQGVNRGNLEYLLRVYYLTSTLSMFMCDYHSFITSWRTWKQTS